MGLTHVLEDSQVEQETYTSLHLLNY